MELRQKRQETKKDNVLCQGEMCAAEKSEESRLKGNLSYFCLGEQGGC